MNHPSPTFLSGSPASPPDVAVLATVFVTVVIVLVIEAKLIFYCLDDLNRARSWPAATSALGPQ
jgi:hypothetical protein